MWRHSCTEGEKLGEIEVSVAVGTKELMRSSNDVIHIALFSY